MGWERMSTRQYLGCLFASFLIAGTGLTVVLFVIL